MPAMLDRIAADLVRDLKPLRFAAPVTHVYNPLVYARRAYGQYLDRYAAPPREIVLLGMNPGPWGMAQTGVPFGEVSHVRDWLGIKARIDKPDPEHPKRPVTGFECRRGEVSGLRLWGWAQSRFKTPDCFFRRFLILNYCPLCFMEESGKNRTPDKLPPAERIPLLAACDRALRRSVEHLQPRWVIGIGAFAAARAAAALAPPSAGSPVRDIRLGQILHPSPASPLSQNWAEKVEKQLAEMGVPIE